MTVGELKKALEGLDDDDWVSGEYRKFQGHLDMEGDPVTLEFYSFRIEDVRRPARKNEREIVLY